MSSYVVVTTNNPVERAQQTVYRVMVFEGKGDMLPVVRDGWFDELYQALGFISYLNGNDNMRGMVAQMKREDQA